MFLLGQSHTSSHFDALYCHVRICLYSPADKGCNPKLIPSHFFAALPVTSLHRVLSEARSGDVCQVFQGPRPSDGVKLMPFTSDPYLG